MRTTNCIRRWRRACGKRCPGGKSRRPSGVIGGGGKEGITPDEADQGEMPMQPNPGATLVVAQAQLLLPVLMEPLDRPPSMGQACLCLDGALIKSPRKVPLRVAVLPRHGALPDQPAERPCLVAVGTPRPQPADLPLGTALLRVQHGHRLPVRVGHRVGERLRLVKRGDLHRMWMGPRSPAPSMWLCRHGPIVTLAPRSPPWWNRLISGVSHLIGQADTACFADLHHIRLLPLLQTGQEIGHVPVAGICGDRPMCDACRAGVVYQRQG